MPFMDKEDVKQSKKGGSNKMIVLGNLGVAFGTAVLHYSRLNNSRS